jgi:Ca2+-binding RTX toxin-like protein
MVLRRAVSVVLGSAALLGFASPAHAAVSVSFSGGELNISGDDENDGLTVGRFNSDLRVTSSTAMSLGSGCTEVSTNAAHCPASGATSADASLGGGNDQIFMMGAAGTAETPLGVPIDFEFGEGNDRLSFDSPPKPGHASVDAAGGGGNDTFLAGPTADDFDGGAGNDTFVFRSGGTGQDNFIGGGDSDIASFQNFFTTPVSATIGQGGIGSDVENISGSPLGGDTLTGNGEDNLLSSGGGHGDSLVAGDGEDRLRGGLADSIFAGPGDDDITIAISGPTGIADGLIDAGTNGPEGDRLLFETVTDAVVRLDGIPNDGRPGDEADVDNVEHVTGGFGSDLFVGNAQDNVLDGGPGDGDLVVGGPGADVLEGGAGGGDTASYESATTQVNVKIDGQPFDGALGEGDAVGDSVEDLVGGPLSDTLEGDADDNAIFGRAGSDTLDGGDGADLLAGAGGDDELEGGDGADDLFGGDQNDTVDGGEDADAMLGGPGTDTADYSVELAAVRVDPEPGGGGDDGLAGEGDSVEDDIERVLGGSGPDDLRGGPGAQTLVGGNGADRLLGGSGRDVLDGGFGGDVLDSVDAATGDEDRCGPDVDEVRADNGDVVASDCETTTLVALPPPPAPPAGPGPGSAPQGPSAPQGGGGGPTPPSNAFTPGSVSGTTLFVTVPGPGQVVVTQASGGSNRVGTAGRRRARKPRKLLARSVRVVRRAGRVRLKLKLTRAGKKLLKRKRRITVRAAIKFTPVGGVPKTTVKRLRIKEPRR